MLTQQHSSKTLSNGPYVPIAPGLLSSGWCEASQLVVHASAWRETSHGGLSGLETCKSRVSKAACKCSTLGSARGWPLGLESDLHRKRSRASPRVAGLHTVVRLSWG